MVDNSNKNETGVTDPGRTPRDYKSYNNNNKKNPDFHPYEELAAILDKLSANRELRPRGRKKDRENKNDEDDFERVITPAPTQAFIPIDDLTIPDELNECLLRVLPRRVNNAGRKGPKGKPTSPKNGKNAVPTKKPKSGENQSAKTKKPKNRNRNKNNNVRRSLKEKTDQEEIASLEMKAFIAHYNGLHDESIDNGADSYGALLEWDEDDDDGYFDSNDFNLDFDEEEEDDEAGNYDYFDGLFDYPVQAPTATSRDLQIMPGYDRPEVRLSHWANETTRFRDRTIRPGTLPA